MPLSPPSLEETFPDDKSVLASQTRAFRTPPPNEEAPGMHRLQYLTPFSEDGSQTLVTDELVSRLAGSPVSRHQDDPTARVSATNRRADSLSTPYLGPARRSTIRQRRMTLD